jgi:hypothetical protein
MILFESSRFFFEKCMDHLLLLIILYLIIVQFLPYLRFYLHLLFPFAQ